MREIPAPPALKAPTVEWRTWADTHFPYDPEASLRIASRQSRCPRETFSEQLEVIQTIRDRDLAADAAAMFFRVDHNQGGRILEDQVRQRREAANIRSTRETFAKASLEGQHGPEARKVAERMLRGQQWTDERLTQVLIAVNAVRNANPTLPGMK